MMPLANTTKKLFMGKSLNMYGKKDSSMLKNSLWLKHATPQGFVFDIQRCDGFLSPIPVSANNCKL